MFRRLTLALFGVLAAVVLLGGATSAALAQGEEPPADGATPVTRWGGGKVTAVGADSFTVQTPRGKLRVIAVSPATQYFTSDGLPAGLADIQVNDRVMGAVVLGPDEQAVARLVIIFGPRTHYRGVGVASSVDDAEQSFNFTARRGRRWEFYVDAGTHITNRAGDVLNFADIDDGDPLFVHAELRADGKWWAVTIKAGR
jgi:hypothetical protein